jgi:hypothetical protein
MHRGQRTNISRGAEFLIMHSTIGRRNVKLFRVGWMRKMVLAQHNSAVCGGWWKGATTVWTRREECNKYDPTAAQCFWLAHHNDWSRWFTISSSPPICYPNFTFMDGVANKYITKIGCENYYCRFAYWTYSTIT